MACFGQEVINKGDGERKAPIEGLFCGLYELISAKSSKSSPAEFSCKREQNSNLFEVLPSAAENVLSKIEEIEDLGVL